MRILDTMLRVNDLRASLTFYTEVLGMKLLRQKDHEEERFHPRIRRLRRLRTRPRCSSSPTNWDRASYTLGDAFDHVALGTDDIKAAVERIRAAGGKIVREPRPMKHGTTVIALVKDLNGYKIELIGGS